MTMCRALAWLFLCGVLHPTFGFQSLSIQRLSGRAIARTCRMGGGHLTPMCLDGGSDGDEGAPPSGPNPEDWRKFRASLISSGIKTTEEVFTQGGKQEQVVERKMVSQGNAELLSKQNPELAEEYLTGVWAHETAEAEVGGLLCRLPIEAQLSNNLPMAGEAGTRWGEIIAAKLQEEAEAGLDEGDTDAVNKRVAAWRANTAYVYRVTQTLIEDKIASLVEGGRLVFDRVDKDQNAQELIAKYSEYQGSWQEVVLVLGAGVAGNKGVVINRPLAAGLSTQLACRLLLGQDSAVGDGDVQLVRDFCRAFQAQGVAYRGGIDRLEGPGTVIHGIEGLQGAVEISPGTGIYEGGAVAAIKGVLEGKYDPLDFRWFLGCREWRGSALEEQVKEGRYRPVASARSLALKQCIALPKPLWHEVMELCGGTSQQLSKLEIQKRDDLSDDEKCM